MSSAAEISLTGLWHGQFSYPLVKAPEFFTANLLESSELIGGSIQETVQNGRHKGRIFYASVSGQRTGNQVRFTKRYETPPRVHSVYYEGMLNADATEIEGTWTVPNSWSGKFLMIRSTGLIQKATKRVAEKI
jgi:hypothetical protein